MMPWIVIAGLALALFLAAYFSKRRFGLLGLALTAGATLSTIWAYDAGLVISSTGLVPNGPLTNAVALSAVVLLPPVLLLFHGYKYKAKIPRLIGSLMFAVLAMAFLLEPLGYAFDLLGQFGAVYDQALGYRDLVISVGVALAVVDIFFTRPVSHESGGKKH